MKLLIWLEWQNSVPTLQTLHHRGAVASNSCSRCGVYEESFLHAVRDCTLSREMWKALGFQDPIFFTDMDSQAWLCSGMEETSNLVFLAGLLFCFSFLSVIKKISFVLFCFFNTLKCFSSMKM